MAQLAEKQKKKLAARKAVADGCSEGTPKRKATAEVLDLVTASKKKKTVVTPLQEMTQQFPALSSLVTQVKSLSKLVVSLKKTVDELKKKINDN